MLRLIIGSICILLGISIFSPLDDIFLLVPLSFVFGPWIIPLVTGIGILLLGIGVYLVGRSRLIPNPIAHHIWLFVCMGLMICAYLTYSLM